jgi:hypothetical protein
MEAKMNVTKASPNVEATRSEADVELPKNVGVNKVVRTIVCK